MTENQARTTANLIMAAAALGAAVFVLRNPKLRRMAWLLARQYATGPLAAWTTGTVQSAWDASGAPGADHDRDIRDLGAIVARPRPPASRQAGRADE
jgi:hypothetical protein